MKQDIQRIMLAAAKPLFLIFILYMLKIVEVGMHWDLSHLGIYPMEKRGVFGILTHPLIHSGFSHLLANTLPLFFLSWCLFYFYRGIAGKIAFLVQFHVILFKRGFEIESIASSVRDTVSPTIIR